MKEQITVNDVIEQISKNKIIKKQKEDIEALGVMSIIYRVGGFGALACSLIMLITTWAAGYAFIVSISFYLVLLGVTCDQEKRLVQMEMKHNE